MCLSGTRLDAGCSWGSCPRELSADESCYKADTELFVWPLRLHASILHVCVFRVNTRRLRRCDRLCGQLRSCQHAELRTGTSVPRRARCTRAPTRWDTHWRHTSRQSTSRSAPKLRRSPPWCRRLPESVEPAGLHWQRGGGRGGRARHPTRGRRAHGGEEGFRLAVTPPGGREEPRLMEPLPALGAQLRTSPGDLRRASLPL